MAFPPLLVIEPLEPPHAQTFIILHGQGSSGDKFGRVLLDTTIPLNSPGDSEPKTTTTLAACFPHARFVFPTAIRRRAVLYKRSRIRQWFDHWELDPPAIEREELQAPGLCESTAYLHQLLRDEIHAVPGGASNVVVGGLSQGCAASLVSLLLWQREPPAAWFGMCGWLPYSTHLRSICHGDLYGEDGGNNSVEDEAEFDPFGRSEEPKNQDPPTEAISWLREELQVEQDDSENDGPQLQTRTPLFFGHGMEDRRVSIVLGRAAHECVRELGFDASWNEYGSLGHWYSGEMLSDLVAFIRERTAWSSFGATDGVGGN